jgi:maleate isomerase
VLIPFQVEETHFHPMQNPLMREAMDGWRARIGLIYPSSGKRDADFFRMAPRGVSVHVARVPFAGAGTLESIGAMSQVENLLAAARLLSDLRPSCITWADTSGSFMFGAEGDAKQVEAIRAATSVPASTTSTACLAAFARLGVSRLAVASPYLSEVNDQLRAFFQAHGLTVVRLLALELDNEWAIHRTSRQKVYALAREAYAQGVDGLFIPCTDFEAVNLIEVLERDLDVPVVTSNQATMWHALRLSGIQDHVPHFGKLLALSVA